MGLFSSKDKEPPKIHHESRNISDLSQYINRLSLKDSQDQYYARIQARQASLPANQTYTPTRRQPWQPITQSANAQPHPTVTSPISRKSDQVISIKPSIFGIHYSGTATTYEELYDTSFIKNKITNRNIIVDKVEKINNPYLQKSYELKKQQKMEKYGCNVKEHLYFHGTKRENVDTICIDNFDWRLTERHKYGKGVSFSFNAMYSTNYSDNGYSKIMLLVKVLVVAACNGDEYMILPPDGYDTTRKNDCDIVVVKYEDCEFYPAFKITYHFKPNFNPNFKNHRRTNAYHHHY